MRKILFLGTAIVLTAVNTTYARDFLYKFLFDLTDDGNWLVDVHASS